MTLVEQARSVLDIAQPRDVAVVGTDPVAVGLAGIRC